MTYGIMAFLSIQLFFLWIVFRRDERIEMMYHRIVGVEREKQEQKNSVKLFVRIFRNLLWPILPGQRYMQKWNQKLTMAGLRDKWSADEFFVYRLFFVFIGFFIAYITNNQVLDYVVFGSGGYFLPAAGVYQKIHARSVKARVELRQMLKIMEVQLERGIQLRRSIQVVSQELQGPLGEALRRTYQMLERDTIKETFTWLKNQFSLHELQKFCILVILGTENGTKVLDIVREQIRFMDDQLNNRVENAIENIKLKITFIILGFNILPFLITGLVGMALNIMNVMTQI